MGGQGAKRVRLWADVEGEDGIVGWFRGRRVRRAGWAWLEGELEAVVVQRVGGWAGAGWVVRVDGAVVWLRWFDGV